ncbi:MAG: PfkB family carbohydrate kinase [bacterium]
MAITVIGSIAIDNIETPFKKTGDILGGSASFFSLASSFLTDVKIIGVVGSDFDRKHLNVFKDRNVDIAGIKTEEGKTFHWAGRYGYDMSDPETLLTELGVFSSFKPVVPHGSKNDMLFLANIDPDIQYNVLKQMDSPELVALDTMNFWIEGKKEKLIKVIELADILIINESEARLLTGESSIFRCAKAVFKLGSKILILKRGAYGATMFFENNFFMVPAYPLENVIDPTGAGDSFAGGFLGYIDNTGDMTFENLKKALVFGNIMASFAVEDFSVNRFSTIKADEIKDRFKKFREMTYFEELSL